MYPICRESRGREGKSGTPLNIDMIQMACIPNLLGRRVRIYYNHRYPNTFSLVYLLEYLCYSKVEESVYTMNDPEDDFEPPKKLHKPLQPLNRFNTTVTKAEAGEYAKGYIPKNTEKNTKWAVNVFNLWVAARNSRMLSDKCPEDLLRKSYPKNELARWLSMFIVEIRRGDGSEYPPKTIYNILAVLLRFMRATDPTTPNFLDQTNVSFS